MSATVSFIDALAPWLALALGIATAVFAEQAFRAASDAEPPDRWRGDDSYFTDFDQREETQERMGRDMMRARAGALQSVATFLGAGAAVEAAAASQSGFVATSLTLGGLLIAIVPSVIRWAKASREIQVTKAWYVRLAWSKTRKYSPTKGDTALEDAAFAKDHPKEAAIEIRSRQRERSSG